MTSPTDWQALRKAAIGKQLYLQLNPTARNPARGKHRRTSPQAYGHPANGAGASTGRTVSTVSWSTVQNSLSWDPIWQSFLNPEPPTLPYAGIRTGEIIGHRAWWVLPDGLYSFAHKFRWEPGATIEGDLDKVIIHDWINGHNIYGGVYAFTNPSDRLLEECYECCSIFRMGVHTFHNFVSPNHVAYTAIGLVRGTVKLWGEVVEHELGWRAQYAKLASIKEWWGDQLNVPEVLEPYRASLKGD